MTDRELMQQALEALEINNQAWKQLADSGDAGFWEAEEQPFYGTSVKAITALRERLAQPEQKPFFTEANGFPQTFVLKPEQSSLDRMAENARELGLDYEPVNTIANFEAIPEQISEPVAMRYDFDGYGYRYIDSGSGSNWQTRIKDAEPLYTTPPPREWVGLSDEEVKAEWVKVIDPNGGDEVLALARAIEAKLKEKNA